MNCEKVPAVQLVDVEPARFDEIDVARCVNSLGGSMHGMVARFPDTSRFQAAYEVLCERFGSRFFTTPEVV